MEESADRRNEAARLLDLPVAALLQDLDSIHVDLPRGLNASEQDSQGVLRLKLLTLWMNYKENICASEIVRTIAQNEDADRKITLVCAIADLFYFSGGLSVAALIVKEGLIVGCEDCWKVA